MENFDIFLVSKFFTRFGSQWDSKGISKSKCFCFLKTPALKERTAVSFASVRSAGEEESHWDRITMENFDIFLVSKFFTRFGSQWDSKGISKSKCFCFLKTPALKERTAVSFASVRSAGEEESHWDRNGI